MHKTTIGKLKVEVSPERETMGKSAAEYVGNQIKKVASEKGHVRVIFASAVSQQEFLSELLMIDDIPWEKITAFHMDEYHMLPADAPQRFGNFLKKHLFRHKRFGEVHYMENDLQNYARLINEAPIDIACLGIGENGHLAFNDPPVADFNDPETTKEVKLDEICRQQQVNDGAFSQIDDVPETAVTLTIPALIKTEFLSVVVPGATKAKAVAYTLFHPISTEWPSTILREHPYAKLFLDTHSAKNILEKIT
ncbi:MAG: 6-phosphogluconolactonase [Balneolaceae bacterium]